MITSKRHLFPKDPNVKGNIYKHGKHTQSALELNCPPLANMIFSQKILRFTEFYIRGGEGIKNQISDYNLQSYFS